ncbi:hypothetical protein KOR34_12860 [Posidoniimonas corsicana]|uniref:Response regulatory domain-containing protein n=1 Tax=Posidoniimonas corsicana TaxID=1938618 RepID=A0A5C5VDY9_9BACT|nr:hypothetical protein [Posidoniimonas corsicana]TWT36381.1 hypothetical protein KOR34_12860 [Posidoniimonas corsicana]
MIPIEEPTALDAASSPASRTLLLGRLSRDELQMVESALPSANLWKRAENLLQAQRVLGEGLIDRVLLAQARPGDLPRDAVKQLRSWAPAAELVAVAGDWCEGELRTGRPWEGVPRVYWWQLADDARETAAGTDHQLVLVNAKTFDDGRMWIDTLRGLGFPSLWARRGRPEPPHSGERLAVWDGDQLDGREADRLAEFCARRRRVGAPVIAVFDYPRGDVVAAATRIGAAAVLGRPWSLEALEQALARVAAPSTAFPEPLLSERRLAA